MKKATLLWNSRSHFAQRIAAESLSRGRPSVSLHQAAEVGETFRRKRDVQDRASGKPRGEKSLVESTAALLRSHGKMKDLREGHHVHCLLCGYGADSSTFLSNCLIDMYGNVGCLAEARSIFDSMPKPNRYTFNIMLKVLSGHGMWDAAVALFESIPDPDVYSWTTLINAYGQNGCVEGAALVFQRMPHKNVVSWTAIISVCTQNGYGNEALDLFRKMQIQGITANTVTFTCILDACAITEHLEEGQRVHAAILMVNCIIDIALGTSLINLYGKCGNIPDAGNCFCSFSHENVAPWTAMISALAQHNYSVDALQLLFTMPFRNIKPDKITFVCAVEACANMASLEAGQLVHVCTIEAGFDEEAYTKSALVVMYGTLGCINDAQRVFCCSSHRSVVSWTGMMGAFVQSGQSKEALLLFSHMLLEGAELDKIALICAINACISLQCLERALEIHLFILNCGHDLDIEIGNALVNMYGKCGSLYHSLQAFEKMQSRDIFSWNTLIAACVQNGEEEEALRLFHRMISDGCTADNITLNCILTACSHGGWIDMGKFFYHIMVVDESVPSDDDCHVCMVDLLSRSGLLDEAEYVAHSLAPKKRALTWLCLLGACKVHGDANRGLNVAYYCMEEDPKNPAVYVLLSNIITALK